LLKQICSRIVNETLDKELKEFEATANKILILFDEKRQFHPQYEDFDVTGILYIILGIGQK
jgi:hypothetical protein